MDSYTMFEINVIIDIMITLALKMIFLIIFFLPCHYNCKAYVFFSVYRNA